MEISAEIDLDLCPGVNQVGSIIQQIERLNKEAIVCAVEDVQMTGMMRQSQPHEMFPKEHQVSVIIPCFDQAERLQFALESVCAQNVACEILVVDDGSCLDQSELIQKAAQRFGAHALRIETRNGPAAARNLGIGASHGQYIAFLDADDVWLPGKLQLQLTQMKAHDLGFSYTRYGNVCGDETREMPAPPELCRQELLRNTAIGCSTVMLSREFMGDMLFPAAQVEDLAYWAALLGETHKAQLVGNDIYVHRVLGGLSASKVKSAWRYWRTLRDTLNIPAQEAVTYLVPYAFRAANKHWISPKIMQRASRAIPRRA